MLAMKLSYGNQEAWYSAQNKTSEKKSFFTFFPLLLGFLFLTFMAALAFILMHNGVLNILVGSLLVASGILCFLLCSIWQIGKSISAATECKMDSAFELGIEGLFGKLKLEIGSKRAPATELALTQFLSQVRSYANEKMYQRNKPSVDPENGSNPHPNRLMEPSDLLKRRWNEVVDTLNEFEIYLSGNPRSVIENLIAKYPNQVSDVSQVFQDVAESFDNTWRRKGITIESAIVKPLKANTNEALLRRALVGPWRTCVFFARRGNSVMFSAKTSEGKVVARWECEGLAIPSPLLEQLMNSETSVNSRIEQGLQELSGEASHSSILFALISFTTWIDFVKEAKINYSLKPSNEGTVFELVL
jgi:hypothetical protein